MKIMLREYQNKDASDVKQVFAEFVEYHNQLDNCFGKISSHCEMFVEYIEKGITEDDFHVTIALADSKITGYCISKIEQKPPVYPTPSFGYIDNIAISGKFQKMGIGTMLFLDALEWFKSQEIHRIECFAAIKNVKSTSFWRKMGFEVYMEQMYLNI